MDDWNKVADEFIEGHQLQGSAAVKARSAMLDWGTLVFGLGLDGVEEVTEELFVRMLGKFYQQNPKYAEEVVGEIYQKLFDISDQDKDGYITEQEFVIMNKAFGFDEASSKKLYQYIGPPEDARGIEKETMVDFWVEFVTGKDQNIFHRIVCLVDGLE